MQIVDSIVAVFDFIVSFIGTIGNGIIACTKIIYYIIYMVDFIFYILPIQLYGLISVFLTVYVVILIYKLVRKG